jgi:hypothetical protein
MARVMRDQLRDGVFVSPSEIAAQYAREEDATTGTTLGYTIRFDGFQFEGMTDGIEMDLAGYNCWDFFIADVPAGFSSREEAETWIKGHHRGLDCDGVNARFSVVGASA